MTAPRILVVETRAHVEYGHYPLIFAERAVDLIELGCDVVVLTSQGWALEGDPAFPSLTIDRFGKVARAMSRFAAGLHHVRPRTFGQRLARTASTAVVVLAARRQARRYRATGVVVVDLVDERVASLLAGSGRWMLYQWAPPARAHRALDRFVSRAAMRAELRREKRGGRMRVTVGTEGMLGSWQRDRPWMTPLVIPFATVREKRSVDPTAARRSLRLPERAQLALFFGTHPGKDPVVVFEAFARLPDWQLVVAGNGAAQAYRAWAARSVCAADAGSPILIDGFVDEATRALLHAAVDLMVLSYQPLWLGLDSAGLVDALSWELPLVCSGRCQAAQITRTNGLGSLFEAGDPDSLVAAVRAAPERPDADGLARARAELSAPRAAQRLLDALDLEGSMSS